MAVSLVLSPSALKLGIFTGAAFGLLFGGSFAALQSDIGAGILAGAIGGLVFGAAMGCFLAWMARRMAGRRPAPDLGDVLVKGAASHVAKAESRGGWLYLTDAELHFRAHRVNIQRKPLSVPLDEIREVAPSRALGLVPNAFTVTTTGGAREKFIVNGRTAWIAAIRGAIQRLQPPAHA